MQKYQISEKIRFQSGARGVRYLGKGWSLPEESHCWSDGSSAEINLTFTATPNYPILLRVKCKGFLPKKEITWQKVSVEVNNAPIGQLEVGPLKWYELAIPLSLVADKRCSIKILIENPTSPFENGLSSDRRQLGIYLDSLVLFELVDQVMQHCEKIGTGADLLGAVYKSNGAFHRRIEAKSYHFYKLLETNGVLDYLISGNLIPDHIFRDIESHDETCMASSELGSYVFPAHYPFLMLKEAALTFIRINKYLLNCFVDQVLGLSDGHYGNFIQIDNATVKWCDIGSISNIPLAYDYGLSEFIKCFIYPLLLVENGEDINNVRTLMHKFPMGLSEAIVFELLGNSDMPKWIFDVQFHKEHRGETLSLLFQHVEALENNSSSGFWASYRNSQALTEAWSGRLLLESPDSRYKAVVDLVRRTPAVSFLDLGCNDGLFSLLCLREGLKGSSIDTENGALDKLYSFTRGLSGIDVSIFLGDFLGYTGPADLVLALALTHHLALGQNLSFAKIVDKLYEVTACALITEFMPDGLGGTKAYPNPSPNPLPEYYKLNTFISELKRRFSSVDVIEYSRNTDFSWYSSRILIYCRK